MSNIFSKPDQMIHSADGLKNSSTTIRTLSESLKNITDNLGMNSSQSKQIQAALGRINQGLIDDAAKASSFHEAILKIADSYKQTEKEILGMSSSVKLQSDNVHDSGTGENGDFQYINSFFRLIETLNLISKYWDDKEKLEEAIHDRYMSYGAQDLLDQTEYAEETWNKASLEERKEILIKFLAELNALMGINVACCQFSNLGESTRGSYSPSKNLVKINLDYINPAKGKSDSYQIMRTMIHEMRHAYQHAVVDNPDQYKVSAETRQEWADNFNDYKNAKKYGYETYVEQPIEYDAKRFAGQYNDIKGYTPTYGGTW